MNNSEKPDLEESTNVRITHRNVDREAAASAREMGVRENGLEPITTSVVVGFVLIATLAGGVLFKDSLLNYDDYPEGYLRTEDPNGGFKVPDSGKAYDVYYKLGKKKFAACASCHGSAGEGGSAPPLNGASWASNPIHLLTIAKQGVKGPIEVLGASYNLNMPAQAASFSDYELAALATYVTNEFGSNKGKNKIVTIEMAQELNERIGKWTEASGGGQVTAEILTSSENFAGELKEAPEGKELKADDIVDKKTGKPKG